MDLLPHLLPLFIGWLATSLALWIEHVVLTDQPWRLEPPATYRVGVLTIIGGYLLFVAVEVAQGITTIDVWIALLALMVMGPGAGVIVEVLYWHDARSKRGRVSAERRGEVIGSTRGILKGLQGDTRAEDTPGRNN